MKRLGLLALAALAAVAALAACSDDTSSTASSSGGSSGGSSSSSSSSSGGGGGGGGGPAGPGFLDAQKITAGGAARTYAIYVPPTRDPAKPLPAVFVFHGDGGTGASIRKSFNLEAVAGDAAIFVYPDGEGRSWNLDDKAPANKDIAFFDALVAEVKKTWGADDKRIFATGYSSGGYFANQLGCRRGSVLRAVASHAAGGPYGADDEYDDNGNLVCPEPPVAALASHGTSDGTVALSEGISSRDYWRRVNQCATTTKPHDPSPCVEYTGCAPGRPVVWCEVPGVGHVVWPSEGAKVTWSFFASL